MQPIEQKILSRIHGRGRGWAFTKTDFVTEFGETNIHQALSSLTRAGKIRRVWANYDLAKPGTLRLVPEGSVRTAAEADYRAMADMIFGHRPAFGEIMTILQALQDEINGSGI